MKEGSVIKIFFVLSALYLPPAFASPDQATGIGDAKSVMCSGPAGQFFMNFPEVKFSTNDWGQIMPDPGLVCVGYKMKGSPSYTTYKGGVSLLNNGPSNTMQTRSADGSFKAFVYTTNGENPAWVKGSGDFLEYLNDGNHGSLACQFYQAAIEACK